MKTHIWLAIGFLFITLTISLDRLAAQTRNVSTVVDHAKRNTGKMNTEWPTPEIKKRMMDLKDYGLNNQDLQYRLAVQGVDSDELRKLQSEGLDIRLLQTDAEKATYDALTVWYDGVVHGTVIGIEHDANPNACFHTTYKVRIHSFEKRPQNLDPQDTIIYILQVSGPLEGGKRIEVSGSSSFGLGRSYLFFITNSHLEYYLGTKTRPCYAELNKYQFSASVHSPSLGMNGEEIRYTCPTTHNSGITFSYADYKQDVLDKVRHIVSMLQ